MTNQPNAYGLPDYQHQQPGPRTSVLRNRAQKGASLAGTIHMRSNYQRLATLSGAARGGEDRFTPMGTGPMFNSGGDASLPGFGPTNYAAQPPSLYDSTPPQQDDMQGYARGGSIRTFADGGDVDTTDYASAFPDWSSLSDDQRQALIAAQQQAGQQQVQAPPAPAPGPPSIAALQQQANDRAGQYGLDPRVFNAQLAQENGHWSPDIVYGDRLSPAGAIGPGQLMPATAKELAVNPYDPAANIEGAARYDRQQLDAFKGDQGAALAAYNAGAGTIQGLQQQYGSDWLAHAPPETQQYVSTIMGNRGTSAPAPPEPQEPPPVPTPPPQGMTLAQAVAQAMQGPVAAGNGGVSFPQQPQDANTPGVTQPNTLLGQLQEQRYNPNDPTAGNVAPDAAQKLGMAAASAFPAIALGPTAYAAGQGLSDLAKTAGAPGIVQQGAQFAPLFLGGVGELPTQMAERGLGETVAQGAPETLGGALRQGAYFTGGSAAAQAAYDKSGAPNLDIPGLGNPIALGAGMLAGNVGAGAERAAGNLAANTASSIADSAIPGFRGAAPDAANPTPLRPSPAGGAPTPEEIARDPFAGLVDEPRATPDQIRAQQAAQALPGMERGRPQGGMSAEEMQARLTAQGLNPMDNPMIAGSKPGITPEQAAAQSGAARNSYGTSLERSGDPGQATLDARLAAALEGEVQRGNLPANEVNPAEAPHPAEALPQGLGAAGETGAAPRPADVSTGTNQPSPVAPASMASPDIAAQQATQAPRTLAPNEVGSISEASSGPPIPDNPRFVPADPNAAPPAGRFTQAQLDKAYDSAVAKGMAPPRPGAEAPTAPVTTPAGASTEPVAAAMPQTAPTTPSATLPPMSEGEINARGQAEAQAVQQTINELKGLSDAALINRAQAAGVTPGQAPLDANGNIRQAWKDNVASATAFVERNKATDGMTQAIMDAKPTSIDEQMRTAQAPASNALDQKMLDTFGPDAMANGRQPVPGTNADQLQDIRDAGAKQAATEEAWTKQTPDQTAWPGTYSYNGTQNPVTQTAGGGGSGGGNRGAGGGTNPLKPLGDAPPSIPQRLWNDATSIISLPLRPLLAGGHFARQGAASAIWHLPEAAQGLNAFRLMLQDPVRADAYIEAKDNLPYVAARPDGRGAADFRPAGSATKSYRDTQAQEKFMALGRDSAPNAPIGDRIVNRTPVIGEILNRLGEAGSAYLHVLRDTTYNTLAENVEKRVTGADTKFYKDLYDNISHNTGHATPVGVGKYQLNLGQAGAARTLGIGPGAALARVQAMTDLLTKSGSPLPWSDGARSEAMKNWLGIGALMGGTAALGNALGAKVQTPWNSDITNSLGDINSRLFKAVTYNGPGDMMTKYGGGSGYDTMARLFGNTGLALLNGDKDKVFDSHGGGIVTSWLRGELGPVPSTALDLVLGKDWRGDTYGWKEFKDDALQNYHGIPTPFIEKWAPIAAQSLTNAWNAYGPTGLIRAAPSIGAFEANTEPVGTSEMRGLVQTDPAKLAAAFPDNPGMPNALKDVDLSTLTGKEKTALQSQFSPEQQQALEANAQKLRDKGDVFQQGRDLSEQSRQQVDQIHTTYAQALDKLGKQLLAGQGDPNKLEKVISEVRKDMNAKVDAAYKPSNDFYASKAYTDAVAKLPKGNSEIQPYLDAYRGLGDRPSVKTPDGYVDTQKLQSLQQAYIDTVKQANPAIGERLAFNTAKDDSWKPPIVDFFDKTVRPASNTWFNSLDAIDNNKNLSDREKAREAVQFMQSHPQEEAIMEVAGYVKAVHSPEAVEYARRLAPDRQVAMR